MDKAECSTISNETLTNMLNKQIGLLIEDFIKILLHDFSSAKNIINIALKQKSSAKIRSNYESEGLHVPPFLIASITSACNLKCKGCYDREKVHNCLLELDENKWSNIFSEARDLGISFILLAGGEPLSKDKVIKECIKFPEIIFPMFTNGTMINEGWIEYFVSCRNLIPVVSIEGDREVTDKRRGNGVFDKVSLNFDLLNKKNIFYGISITLTSENYDNVLNSEFIKNYTDKGCRLFFFIEYIPFAPGTESYVLSDEQKTELDNKLNILRDNFKAIFITFPGDEKIYGGCLAAGRGFVHINAAGGVEACPFAPYSDSGLKDLSLKEALSSPILNEIRSLHGILQEHNGGCTLFDNKEIVKRHLGTDNK